MDKKRYIFLFFFAMLLAINLFAQYPQNFTYDDKNGLPSNEVYSIVQDQRGFIWFGCDAGLFKFDGVRYTSFKSATQTAKSFTNLVLSNSGIIYCTNFQDQIFYLEHDTLKELKNSLNKVSNITVDKKGILYATHNDGISSFDTEKQKWFLLNNGADKDNFMRSVTINDQNQAYFLTQTGIGTISDGKIKVVELPDYQNNVASSFMLTCCNNEVWIISRGSNLFYTLSNGKITQNTNQNLINCLQNRKVTGVKTLPDGKLWITTYNGVICYDTKNESLQIFYPDLAFSDVIIDREQNYWFTTLQTGILRVPDLNFLVWNRSNESIKNEKLIHLATDGTHIYFSSINGHIGKLNSKTNALQTFHTGNNADIESFDFDKADHHLYFSTQNKTYSLKDDKISEETMGTNSLKSLLHIPPYYFFASSQGLYVQSDTQTDKICETWCRKLLFDSFQNVLWAASNKGLMLYKRQQNQWICTDTLFKNTQVLSIDIDTITHQIFALTFDGNLHAIRENLTTYIMFKLPEEVQPNTFTYHNNRFFVASNKGLLIFDSNPYNLKEENWQQSLNTLSGLTSKNIQDILILNENIWLATGNGLQKIPLATKQEKPLAKIYLKKQYNTVNLNYGESLTLSPEASIYNANGNFEYAYRINKKDWVKLPSTIEQIEIHNLSAGAFEIELKAIDHLGRDSENSIFISGYVHPPFWQKWWFFVLMGATIFLIAFFIFKKRIRSLQNKQQKEIDRIVLENELRMTQQSALKAQMNPHFIFNVLNSIKGYIYQNDKKNATLYLSQFANLIRKILEQSSISEIRLEEEIEILKLYIKLEAMLLDDEFEYEIIVDKNIQSNTIKIPSLLIQPIVENAFKHGLRHKVGLKKLNVDVELNEELKNLIITITDNGIGREAAEKINQNQNKTHQSFASSALTKRIKLLNHENTEAVGLEIIDLKDNENNISGTKVILRIGING